MSRLTREDEHRLNEYNRRVKEGGIDALSEDDQLWYSLLTDRYEKFLEVGLRVMKQAAEKEGKEGGLFGFLSNVGGSSYKSSDIAGASSSSNSYRNSVALDDNTTTPSRTTSPPPQMDDRQFVATFGHPAAAAPAHEFPSHHWSWIQENLAVGALPFSANTKDTPGHISELQEQALRRFCKVSLVVSCLEMDEEPPNGFTSLKDWDNVFGTTSFISVPLPKDPNQPIPKSAIQEVITACAQISSISHANMRSSTTLGNNSMSPVGARITAVGAGGEAGGASPAAASSGNNNNGSFAGSSSNNATAMMNGSFDQNPNNTTGDSPSDSSMGVAPQQQSGSGSPTRSTGIGGALRRLTQAANKPPDLKRIAYIHCKAGTQRCFVVAACYLMSQHGRSYEDTERFLRLVRPSFRPSPAQMDFVKAFGEYIAKPIILQPRSDDEELYQKVLADVLSLAPSHRQRLLRDLEKLT